jgi:hypothetical protein
MQMNDPCRALSQGLRDENGGFYGFVMIWRRGQSIREGYRRGVTVEQFLSHPDNLSGSWLIDGGWGGPPGPLRVDWLDEEFRWECKGYTC